MWATMEAIRVAAPVKHVEIAEEDRLVLQRIVRASSSEVRMVERARIVLSAAEGLAAREIAERVGCSLPTVVKWRQRFARDGVEGCGTRRGRGHRCRTGRRPGRC